MVYPSTVGVVDLSHVIRDGMVTYPGLPAPEISDFLSREDSRARYAPGTEFQIGRISMIANTGTYVDAPSHRFADGVDLSGLDLARLVDVPGIVVRAPQDTRAVDVDAFDGRDVAGAAVLVHTGWDAHWETEAYGTGAPFLTRAAAEWLAARGPAVVGIDSVNIDDVDDGTRPAHTELLRAGIPVVEHLTRLGELPASGFRFHAAPAPVAGMGTWPVRAYALVP
jgi:kynurenine formamidase